MSIDDDGAGAGTGAGTNAGVGAGSLSISGLPKAPTSSAAVAAAEQERLLEFNDYLDGVKEVESLVPRLVPAKSSGVEGASGMERSSSTSSANCSTWSSTSWTRSGSR